MTSAARKGKHPTSLAPKRSSVQQAVIETLRAAIFSGELQPGDPIMELHVARRCQVSQTSVREALTKLEHTGLVRRVPNVGTFVTQLSSQEICEHLRLRIILEPLAGMEAVRFMDQAALAELERRSKALTSTLTGNRYFDAAQADLEFHSWIWEESGDKTLAGILNQLSVPLFAFLSMQRRRTKQDLMQVVAAHEPIVDAFRRRDPAAVREAIENHIHGSYADLLAVDTGRYSIVTAPR